MPFVSSTKREDVQGTMICKVIDVSFTGAGVTSGHVKTGLSNVIFAAHNNEVTATGRVKLNRNAADTAAEPGSIFLVGFTAEDATVQVIVYGN